jgi:hypothetical protein
MPVVRNKCREHIFKLRAFLRGFVWIGFRVCIYALRFTFVDVDLMSITFRSTSKHYASPIGLPHSANTDSFSCSVLQGITGG